jgi:hypothetical protein
LINLKPKLKTLLEQAAPAFFYYPKNFNKLPCISYYEAFNAPAHKADDSEYLSEVSYVIDIWTDTSAEGSQLADKVNELLTNEGFGREFSQDVYEPAPQALHKTMRFKYLGG